MAKAHLSDDMVGQLEFTANENSRYEIFDASVENLAIRVGSRSKTFVLAARFGGNDNTTRRKLGNYPAMTTEAARVEAHKWNTMIGRGIDPASEADQKRKEEELGLRSTFESVMLDYIAQLPGRPRNLSVPREIKFIKSFILNPAVNPWLRKPISLVEDHDVGLLVDKHRQRSPSAGLHCFTTLKTFFAWAMAPNIRNKIGLQHNPLEFTMAKHFSLYKGIRGRVFEYEEARAYLLATKATLYPYGPCLRALFETGQRIGVVSAMRWSQINLERKLWIIPGTRSKRATAGRTSKLDTDMTLPLSDNLVFLLREVRDSLPASHGDFVFSSSGGQTPIANFSNLKRDNTRKRKKEKGEAGAAAVDASVALGSFGRLMRDRVVEWGLEYEPWVWHDLRRTVRTHLEPITRRQEVAETAIGHGPQGIVRVYNLHKYRAEIRRAFNIWSELLCKVEDGTCTIADWEHDPEAWRDEP